VLQIIGVNYKSAPLAIRESLACIDAQLPESLSTVVCLHTCNRSEFITLTEHLPALDAWLAERVGKAILPYLYEYADTAALVHLLQVATGLDSMVLGEPQILGQLKQAYRQATERVALGRYLGYLFPFVFSVAKKVRTQTGISTNSVSVAYTAVSLAKNIFSDLQEAKVLLIGAGETIKLVAQHLAAIPVKQIIIANRTLEKSVQLADRVGGQSIRIADIPEYLGLADMVFSSTASQLPLLGKGLLERAVKQRKHKPMFMVDLAMPRDIEPEVGELEDIYLYNLDDLQKVVQDNLQHRERAAEQANAIIQLELEQFTCWQNSLQAVPLIRTYRESMEGLRDKQVAKAYKALQKGQAPESVVQRLARDLTNKMMHAPTVEMHKAAYQGRFQWLAWVKQLLQLPNEKRDESA
jgi:glutamyl-tRNA reductase